MYKVIRDNNKRVQDLTDRWSQICLDLNMEWSQICSKHTAEWCRECEEILEKVKKNEENL